MQAPRAAAKIPSAYTNTLDLSAPPFPHTVPAQYIMQSASARAFWGGGGAVTRHNTHRHTQTRCALAIYANFCRTTHTMRPSLVRYSARTHIAEPRCVAEHKSSKCEIVLFAQRAHLFRAQAHAKQNEIWTARTQTHVRRVHKDTCRYERPQKTSAHPVGAYGQMCTNVAQTNVIMLFYLISSLRVRNVCV